MVVIALIRFYSILSERLACVVGARKGKGERKSRTNFPSPFLFLAPATQATERPELCNPLSSYLDPDSNFATRPPSSKYTLSRKNSIMKLFHYGFKCLSMIQPGRTRQEVIILKSPIWLKLGRTIECREHIHVLKYQVKIFRITRVVGKT